MRRDPARSIIEKLGGIQAVAELTGAARTTVSGWMRSGDARGTDGEIPRQHRPALIAAARARGIPLDFEDFTWIPDGGADHGEAA